MLLSMLDEASIVALPEELLWPRWTLFGLYDILRPRVLDDLAPDLCYEFMACWTFCDMREEPTMLLEPRTRAVVEPEPLFYCIDYFAAELCDCWMRLRCCCSD